MDFDLSPDQVALQETAGELLAGRSGPAVVRAVVDGGGGWDRDLWQAMVEQGWTAVVVPEVLGGLGLGFVEAAVLLEQVGRHVAPAPVLGHLVAQAMLVAGGDGVEQLAGLVTGEQVAAVAWRPFDAVEDPGAAGGWRLTGASEPAPFLPTADVVVVRGADALFAVELDGATLPAALAAMDRTRQVGRLALDGAPARRLGGSDLVEAFLDCGATAYAAELLGVAARSLELSVAYASEREQFGKPIGSFQAVKHRCADMLVDVEGMRSAAYYAAWCVAAGDPDRSIAASTAKTWCSDAGRRVTASALQVHGGIGFTWESDVHLFLKRAQLDEGAFGDAVFHRQRLGGLLRARVEAGQSVI